MSHKARVFWTFAITSVGVFMVTLDNLVVTTALPVIREDLHASIENLEWTVNAYTLTFAVLLLTGAALGDRFGRRRLFAIGLGIFTLASAAAAMAGAPHELIAARAPQGRRHGGLRQRADRGARAPGARRGDRAPADAGDPLRGGAAGAARRRTRRL